MGIIEKSLLRQEPIIKKAIASINHRLPKKMNERETHIKLECVGGEFCEGVRILL